MIIKSHIKRDDQAHYGFRVLNWQSRFRLDYVIVGIYVGGRNGFEVLKGSTYKCLNSKRDTLVLKSNQGFEKIIPIDSWVYFCTNEPIMV
jgi:hypothetical protein